MICVLALTFSAFAEDRSGTCRNVENIYKVCVNDRNIVGSSALMFLTDDAPDEENTSLFGNSGGSSRITHVPKIGTTAKDIKNQYLADIEHVSHLQEHGMRSELDRGTFSYSGAVHPARMDSPVIVSILELEMHYLFVSSVYPNMFMQEEGKVVSDAQLAEHDMLIHALMPVKDQDT